jgi:hypothetical protein
MAHAYDQAQPGRYTHSECVPHGRALTHAAAASLGHVLESNAIMAPTVGASSVQERVSRAARVFNGRIKFELATTTLTREQTNAMS